MRCRVNVLLLAFSVLTLTGCASGPEIAQPPTQLSEINQLLEQADATILWTSGERIPDAKYVRVSPDSIYYRIHTDPGGPGRWERPPVPDRNEKTHSRSIHAVQRIEAHVGGGGGFIGLAAGAAPGTILAGLSLASGLAQDCGESSSYACGLGPAIGLYWGVIGSVVGGLIGAIIGEVSDTDRRVIYRGPVDQYLMR
jgi:hypothetical protein